MLRGAAWPGGVVEHAIDGYALLARFEHDVRRVTPDAAEGRPYELDGPRSRLSSSARCEQVESLGFTQLTTTTPYVGNP